MNEFVRRYEAEIAALVRQGLFAPDGYFNIGYWRPGVHSQEQACRTLVEEHLKLFPAAPGTVLDLACGSGATTRQVRRSLPAATVIGVDLSLPRLTAGRRASSGIPLGCMDAARLAVAEASFDVVLCVEAAFHFDSRARFLAQAHRALRAGGALVLSDILFRDPSRIGGWMVPAGNRVRDLDAYLAGYRQAGFGGLRWTDATDACWHGFCRHRRRLAEAAASDLGEVELADRVRSLDDLELGSVDRYLLVAAYKASGA